MPPQSARQHAEWLSLIEASGPFLSLGTLVNAFPVGLDAHDPEVARDLRRAHAEWEDEHETDPTIQQRWVDFVLARVLELPESVLRMGQEIPGALRPTTVEGQPVAQPDAVVVEPAGDRARLLLVIESPERELETPDPTSAGESPAERVERLCGATGVRLALLTNGEQWMLIDAVAGQTTSRTVWQAILWIEEPLTLRAFRSLLGVSRFFSVAEDETLEALLAASAENQQQVTDQLGAQVRRAVEMLVHALDLADRARDHSLLREVSDQEVYEACLTVMMRLVVLLSAEERDLLLLGDQLWDESYAIGTLRAQLRADADRHGEEVLERRADAWPRLLATFRAVYGGVEHGSLRLPAYGGALLNPDRFPFLEGRANKTSWRETPAHPLPVDNRTVLHLLDALQQLEVRVPGGKELRALSFRGLDVEQIGHVYEGLLDHTAFRTSEPAVALRGKKEPELALSLIEEQRALEDEQALIAFLKDETGLSVKQIEKGLAEVPDEITRQRLFSACENDAELLERVEPYAALVRVDSFDYPLVFPEGSLFVTADPRRRNTGTHYTPPSLTGPIVRYALEPAVYEGPSEGWERERWRLRSSRELLDLKVCDIAMGSGAFLVQACRYLAERLLEAWEAEDAAIAGARDGEPLPADPAERLVYARRLIASRCLYGIDKDPMAVEMAKLSLWLVTLAKGKPFTFLDHALRCGDSLLGITRLEQLADLSLDAGQRATTLSLFAQPVHDAVEQAIVLRAQIEQTAPIDVSENQAKAAALSEADAATEDLRLVADLVVGAALSDRDPGTSVAAAEGDIRALLIGGDDVARTRLGLRATELLTVGKPEMEPDRRPFHWPLEFPEVFAIEGREPGFDAIVGNPPFLGGQRLTGTLGLSFREHLVRHLAAGRRGSADLCTYFFLRGYELLGPDGELGLLATNTIAQGDTREVGLAALLERGASIPRATASRPWPGVANLEVAEVWLRRSAWNGLRVLDGDVVEEISSYLAPPGRVVGEPHGLASNAGMSFIGSYVLGLGFVLTPEEAQRLVDQDPRNGDVLFPYLTGEDLQSRPDQSPSRWVVNFFDWPIERAATYAEPFAIVEANVKPERMHLNGRNPTATDRAKHWWRYGRRADALYETLVRHPLAFVRSRVSSIHAPSALPLGVVTSEATVVFVADDWGEFSVLQSSIHEAWIWRQASSLETRIRYTPSDCFETHPFPDPLPPGETGQELHDFRGERTRARDEGLTKLANRVNDPEQTDADVVRLRELMTTMDREVANAYGWDDLELDHGFHETRFGVRFTLGPAARQEILDRLLELNHERYAAEVERGLHDKRRPKTGTR